jgi:hypothetical protein
MSANRAAGQAAADDLPSLAGTVRQIVPTAALLVRATAALVRPQQAFRRLNRELYATYRARTESLLAFGQAAGAFQRVDVARVAALIVGIVIGIVAQSYFDPRAVDAAALVDEATATVLARLSRSHNL